MDVKPRHRLKKPEVVFTFSWTREAVTSRGWRYEVWSEPAPAVLENIRFLADYCRVWLFDPDPVGVGPGGIQAYKFVLPAGSDAAEPDLRTHEGYDWVYALNGTLRLVLGEHDLILKPGEAAEFDTRPPHWFGATGAGPVEYLSLMGKQGERAHVRAAPG
ncbi:cupin domain-containing protein [Streptomyces sp. NPDC088554]|uniref:cupin domain-containing protein n=1 Tax=Streptomyces sp. NPDC088554 TaxID=3365865 RepID=UPI00382C46A2